MPSEDSDQLGHPLKDFAVCIKEALSSLAIQVEHKDIIL